MNSEMKPRAIDNLLTSLKRRMARERNIRGYLDSVDKFCKFAKTEPDQIVSDVKTGKITLVDLLQKFVDQMVTEELAPKTTRRIYYQVQKFFRANKVKIEAKSVELPIARVIYADRAITKDEVKLLLRTGDLRQRWVVLLMASSGIRLGSIPDLRLKHLEKWNKASVSDPVKLTIPSESAKDYRGYTTFITPEAYEALQDYLNLRRKYAEPINEETLFVRDVFPKEPNGASEPKPLSYYGLNTVMRRMMNTYLHTEKKRRHDFKMSHGFRKFFRTALDSAGVPVGASEALMGHSAGLVGVYTRHSDEALKELYARAIPNLAIERAVISELERRKQVIRDMAKGLGLSEEKRVLLENALASAKDDEALDRILSVGLENVTAANGGTPINNGTNSQVVITESELEDYLGRGYRFVSILPSGKIVVES